MYTAPECYIDSVHLVPGDIVIIRNGESIDADMRVFECSKDFTVDQSALTGESYPVKKSGDKCLNDEPPFDAENLIFNGCFCIDGEAKCVIFAIGDDTFSGKNSISWIFNSR